MKHMNLFGPKDVPEEVFSDEQIGTLVVVVEHYLPNNVALSWDHDIDKSEHQVYFYTEDDNPEKDWLIAFKYVRDTQDVIVTALDVYKFGIPMWTEVAHRLLVIGAQVQCRRIVFVNDNDGGDIHEGREPLGATKQEDGSWVCALR